MANLIDIKHKLVEKIATFAPTATPREMTFLSKSLERLNNAVKADMQNDRYGETTTFHQQQVAKPPLNHTHPNAGRNSSNPEYALYSAHYGGSNNMTLYSETGYVIDSYKNSWCAHHHNGNGGQWSYWSSGQRQSCDSWNGNPCYFGGHNHTHQSACYNNGGDTCGPLGNANLLAGQEAAYANRFWRDGNQATGRAPRHEYRNENYIVGEIEPSDKETYIVYDKTTIYLKNRRVLPGAGANANFSQKSTSNGTVSAFGTLTHNADRGELIVMNHHATQVDGYGVADWMNQVKIYYDIPTITIDTNLATALNDNTAKQTFVRFDDAWDSDRVPTWSNTEGPDSTAWPSGNIRTKEGKDRTVWHPTDYSGGPESRPLCVTDNKITLTNNGDVYYSINYRYGHTLFKSTRYRDPLTELTDDNYYEGIFVPEWNKECSQLNVRGYDEHRQHGKLGYEPIGTRPTRLETLYLSECYGRDTDTNSSYGPSGASYSSAHFAIQSRNKKNVALTCNYYRYGSGTASYIVDKRFNRWMIAAYIRETSHGCQWGPLGKEGFVLSWNRGVHSSDLGGYRKYYYRQNSNSGTWHRGEYGHQFFGAPAAHTYPALVPILY